MIAVTDTAVDLAASASVSGALSQVMALVVAGLVVVVPLLFLWARSKIETATTLARAETLEAQVRLAKAESAAREAARLNTALVTKIENDAAELTPAEAKKTKSGFAAVAESFGASAALTATVEKLGFSKSGQINVPREPNP